MNKKLTEFKLFFESYCNSHKEYEETHIKMRNELNKKKENLTLRESKKDDCRNLWVARLDIRNGEFILELNSEITLDFDNIMRLAKWLQELFLEEEKNVRKKDT